METGVNKKDRREVAEQEGFFLWFEWFETHGMDVILDLRPESFYTHEKIASCQRVPSYIQDGDESSSRQVASLPGPPDNQPFFPKGRGSRHEGSG